MAIHIAVCDDRQEFLDFMQRELSRIADTFHFSIKTYLYNHGNQVLDLIFNYEASFDILFLDIDMPDISGLDIARKLQEYSSDFILIFISAHEEYVFDSIQYHPFRYIRKSRISQELPSAVKAACSRLKERKRRCIIVKTQDSEVKLRHSEIMYFQTSARKVEIHLEQGRILTTRTTIKELLAEINDDTFIKIHSGGIVNAKYIHEFSNHDVTLDNGEKLMVSRRQIKPMKTALMKYWGGIV